jgi:hypothetical protein
LYSGDHLVRRCSTGGKPVRRNATETPEKYGEAAKPAEAVNVRLSGLGVVLSNPPKLINLDTDGRARLRRADDGPLVIVGALA